MKPTSTPQASLLGFELEQRGVVVEREKWDGHKHIDLVIPRAQLNIEVDGRQHYENAQQILRDLKRTHHSDRRGWDTIHIPNAFIDNRTDLVQVANALAIAARERAHQLGHRCINAIMNGADSEGTTALLNPATCSHAGES
jgi:very-short-patch-repair endonuclease